MTTVTEEWGLCCPNCHKDDKIGIVGRVSMILTPHGTESCGDHEWDDDCDAVCDHCNHVGTVGGFRVLEA